MRVWVILVATLLGCTTVGTDYKKPESEKKLPTDFNAPPDPSLKPGIADLEKWWKVFDDALLNDLVQRAAKQNLDVRIAIARVNEARARVDVATAGRSPQIGVGSNAGLAGTGGLARSSYGASIDASWEFGVVRCDQVVPVLECRLELVHLRHRARPSILIVR